MTPKDEELLKLVEQIEKTNSVLENTKLIGLLRDAVVMLFLRTRTTGDDKP
jgi:hypothetical protein